MKIFSVNFNKSINDKYGAVATLGSTAKLVPDEKGVGLKCNSLATDYITYGDISAINAIGTGEFSYAVCANIKAFLNHGSALNSLIGKVGLANTGFALDYSASNSINAYIVDANISATLNLLNQNNIFVFTRNSVGLCTLYINGVMAGSPLTKATTISTAGLMTIGYDGYASSRSCNATIYSTEVYNHCLTQNEIDKLTADFKNQMVFSKPKRGFIYPKPTDLSNQKDNVFGSNLITSAPFTIDSASNQANIFTNSSNPALNQYAQLTYTVTANSLTNGATLSLYGTTSYSGAINAGTTFPLDNSLGVHSVKVLCDGAGSRLNTVFRALNNSTGSGTITITDVSLKLYTGLIAAYSMIPQGTTLVDISGNGNNMTLTGGNTVKTKNGTYFPNSGYYKKTSFTGLSAGANAYSISVRIKFKEINREQHLFECTTSQRYVTNSNLLYMSGASNPLTGGSTIAKDKWYTITFLVKNPGAEIYLDGVSDGSNANYTENITLTAYLGMLYSEIGAYKLNAEVLDVRIHNYILSVQEIKDYHNSFAKQITLQDDFCQDMADNQVRVPNQWENISGTFKLNETTIAEGNYGGIPKGTKYLECSSTGVAIIPSNQAYGTWQFDVYNAGLADIVLCGKGGIMGSPYTDSIYWIRITVAGSLSFDRNTTDLMLTANGYFAQNTWYSFKVTRTNTGVWTVLAKGGSLVPTAGYDGYHLVSVSGGSGANPVTDNTYTTCTYFGIHQSPANRFTNLVIKNGIIIN